MPGFSSSHLFVVTPFPLRFLFSIDNIESMSLRFEIFHCKLCYFFRFIRSATEYVQVNSATCISKMGGDQRSFDQLRHTKSSDTRFVSKIDNLRLTIALHFNTIDRKSVV